MKRIAVEVKKKLSLLLAVAMVIGSIPSNTLTVAAAEPNTQAVLEEAAPVEEATTLAEEETTPAEETERIGIKSDSTVQSTGGTFIVTTSVTPDKATVNFTAGTTTETDTIKTAEGEDLVFTVTPESGYQVTEVKYSIEGVDEQKDPAITAVDGVTNYTIGSAEMTDNVAITVTTAELPVITVQDDASDHATVELTGGYITETQTDITTIRAKTDEAVTFTVTPDEDYEVTAVKYQLADEEAVPLDKAPDADGYTIPSDVIVLGKDIKITVTTQRVTFDVAVQDDEADNATVDFSTGYSNGKNVKEEDLSFAVVPDERYMVKEVKYKVGGGQEEKLVQ
ncbi:MAG: hypothetical protein ACI4DN_11490 [Lachnospiraceae bacterium]